MIATLFGSISGFALGLTGGGGAILTLPLMIYGLHVPVHQAVLLSLCVVCFTALVGLFSFARFRKAHLQTVVVVSLGGIFFAPVGALFSVGVSEVTLLLTFSMLMVVVGAVLFFKAPILTFFHATAIAHPRAHSLNVKFSWLKLLICGGLCGLTSGFFGVGAGFLLVPTLVMVVLLPLAEVVSTSLLIIFMTSLMGILTHLQSQQINWSHLLPFLVGSMLGVSVGGLVATKFSEKTVNSFSATFVFLAGVMLYLYLPH